MINKKCDICGSDEDVKTFNVNLNDDSIDIYGKIDLCENCANKIKISISKIQVELEG